ncbi:hypothetical protein [Micromonospora eburnea]|nr:hypothetical protein [Micromonospora eburnea]
MIAQPSSASSASVARWSADSIWRNSASARLAYVRAWRGSVPRRQRAS